MRWLTHFEKVCHSQRGRNTLMEALMLISLNFKLGIQTHPLRVTLIWLRWLLIGNINESHNDSHHQDIYDMLEV